MVLGRIVRYDDIRGYGFVAPANGGEDVFVHANDFGEYRHFVQVGMAVEFEAEEGERGLKVANIRIADRNGDGHAPTVPQALPRNVAPGDEDEMCDVLSAKALVGEVTEMLIRHTPSLTGADIARIRQHFLDLARLHHWVEP